MLRCEPQVCHLRGVRRRDLPATRTRKQGTGIEPAGRADLTRGEGSYLAFGPLRSGQVRSSSYLRRYPGAGMSSSAIVGRASATVPMNSDKSASET